MKSSTKLCSALLALSCALTSLPTTLASNADTLQTIGITVPNTQTITRGQFAVLLYDLTEKTALTTAQSPFSDVDSTRSDAQAITAIYSLGLLSGCGDGTFAPDRAITLGEAVTSLLRLLDYTSADIGYRWPEDYLLKAQSIGLIDGGNAWDTVTSETATELCYQVLISYTKNGTQYGKTVWSSTVDNVVLLANSSSNGDQTDLLSVLSNGNVVYYQKNTVFPSSLMGSCRGSLLLDNSGRAIGFLPNDEQSTQISLKSSSALGITSTSGGYYTVPTTATLVLGETKTTFGSGYHFLGGYNSALICYGSSGTVELVVATNDITYQDFVLTGYYENSSPNPYQPTTVTLLGCTLTVDPEIASKFAQFAYGDRISVVLDENGLISNVYSQTTSQSVVGLLNGSSITLANGLVLSGECTNDSTVENGQLVRVTPTGMGEFTLYKAQNSVNSTLDWSAQLLGSTPISENVTLYECVSDSSALLLSKEGLTLGMVPASSILYHQINSQGEVDLLLLDNVTGDRFAYGIIEVANINSSSSFGTISNRGYKLITDEGETTPVVTHFFNGYDGEVGGIITNSEGEFEVGIVLTPTLPLSPLAFSGSESLVSNGVRIPIDSDVMVYHEPYQRWITLETAFAQCDNFVGYYDQSPDQGGKIRVIFAY